MYYVVLSERPFKQFKELTWCLPSAHPRSSSYEIYSIRSQWLDRVIDYKKMNQWWRLDLGPPHSTLVYCHLLCCKNIIHLFIHILEVLRSFSITLHIDYYLPLLFRETWSLDCRIIEISVQFSRLHSELRKKCWKLICSCRVNLSFEKRRCHVR